MMIWFGLVCLFIHSVTYVTLDMSNDDDDDDEEEEEEESLEGDSVLMATCFFKRM